VWLQLAAILRDQILSGEIGPDEPIPSQKELRESYHVARGTVARAVKELQAVGLVFVVKGKGAFVVLNVGELSVGVMARWEARDLDRARGITHQ
jgi:GntR family transcriptional regulator